VLCARSFKQLAEFACDHGGCHRYCTLESALLQILLTSVTFMSSGGWRDHLKMVVLQPDPFRKHKVREFPAPRLWPLILRRANYNLGSWKPWIC